MQFSIISGNIAIKYCLSGQKRTEKIFYMFTGRRLELLHTRKGYARVSLEPTNLIPAMLFHPAPDKNRKHPMHRLLGKHVYVSSSDVGFSVGDVMKIAK